MCCLKCGDDHVNHVWEPLKDAKGPFQGHPGGYLMISSIPVTKCEEVGVGEGWTVTRIELQRLLRTAWGFHSVKGFFQQPRWRRLLPRNSRPGTVQVHDVVLSLEATVMMICHRLQHIKRFQQVLTSDPIFFFSSHLTPF